MDDAATRLLTAGGDAAAQAAGLTGPVDYPIHLAIAYLFLVGYFARTLFVSMRLPASVGVILTGFFFSYFIQADIFLARDGLQQLAFFLVLLTAALEITLEDLNFSIILCACVPATFEILAIATYGVFVLGYIAIEGLVMGTVLVALGDGLVIPKMKEFGARFKGHPIPRLVFTWAPLEASFVLTLFGLLVSLSAPAHQPKADIALLFVANVVRLGATLLVGAALGAASGWLITRRTRLTLHGQQVFTGASVEAFLMVIAVALVAFGLGQGDMGEELVPMGFSPGSLFQPELLVIITGTFFAAVSDIKVLRDVEGIMGGVWVFGQLILFSMLGSRTSPRILPQILKVLPIIVIGLLFRFVGVLIAMYSTVRSRGWEDPSLKRYGSAGVATTWKDAVFCFLSTIPRASIQGTLGSLPLTERFFEHRQQQREAQEFIFVAARLYILFMSVVGMILLNTWGPRLLQDTCEQYGVQTAGSDFNEVLTTSPDRPNSSDTDVAGAVEMLAEEYSIDTARLTQLLTEMATAERARLERDGADEPCQEPWTRSISEPSRSPMQRGRTGSEDQILGINALAKRRHGPRHRHDLVLSQFDAMGSLVAAETVVGGKRSRAESSHASLSSWRSSTATRWALPPHLEKPSCVKQRCRPMVHIAQRSGEEENPAFRFDPL